METYTQKTKEQKLMNCKTNKHKQLFNGTNIFCRVEFLVKRFFAPLGKEL